MSAPTAYIPAITGLEEEREVTRKYIAFGSLAVYFLIIGLIAYRASILVHDKESSKVSVGINDQKNPTSISPLTQNNLPEAAKEPEKKITISNEKDSFSQMLQLLSSIAAIMGGIVGAIIGFYFRGEKST
ncbi:hypothetical protein GCM10028808_62480 [Spirosoma migulaei]